MNREDHSTKMKKNLGIATAISTVVGCVIGSGVFFKPQAIFNATGGAPGLGILAWLVTGMISIAGALTFSEVAILIPETGGIPTYLNRIYGPKMGFLAGWSQMILFYPAMISALAVAFAQQAALFAGERMIVPIAVTVIFSDFIFEYAGITNWWRYSDYFYIMQNGTTDFIDRFWILERYR